jgi:hypothetical protein
MDSAQSTFPFMCTDESGLFYNLSEQFYYCTNKAVKTTPRLQAYAYVQTVQKTII